MRAMTHLLDELIRDRASLCIRRLPLKATLSEVLSVEGEPTERRDPTPGGSAGFVRYARELGELEDLTLTYVIGPDARVAEVDLILTSCPFGYWEKAGGCEDESWHQAVESASLTPLAPLWTATRDTLLSHLCALLGDAPKPTKPKGGFTQKRHEGKVWKWVTPEAHVTLMTYVDDFLARGAGDIKLFLKLTIAS